MPKVSAPILNRPMADASVGSAAGSAAVTVPVREGTEAGRPTWSAATTVTADSMSLEKKGALSRRWLAHALMAYGL